MRKRERERDRKKRERDTHKEREEQERTTEALFFNSDYISNLQGERAESGESRLAFELQEARQIILLLQVSQL